MSKFKYIVFELTRYTTCSRIHLFKVYRDDVSDDKLIFDLEQEVNRMGGEWDGATHNLDRDSFRMLLSEFDGVVESGG